MLSWELLFDSINNPPITQIKSVMSILFSTFNKKHKINIMLFIFNVSWGMLFRRNPWPACQLSSSGDFHTEDLYFAEIKKSTLLNTSFKYLTTAKVTWEGSLSLFMFDLERLRPIDLDLDSERYLSRPDSRTTLSEAELMSPASVVQWSYVSSGDSDSDSWDSGWVFRSDSKELR